MKLEMYANIIVPSKGGQRYLRVKDLSYDEELKAFRYVYTGQLHVTLREHVIGYSERKPGDD